MIEGAVSINKREL